MTPSPASAARVAHLASALRAWHAAIVPATCANWVHDGIGPRSLRTTGAAIDAGLPSAIGASRNNARSSDTFLKTLTHAQRRTGKDAADLPLNQCVRSDMSAGPFDVRALFLSNLTARPNPAPETGTGSVSRLGLATLALWHVRRPG